MRNAKHSHTKTSLEALYKDCSPIIEQVPVATLRPYQRQLKKHSPQQIELLANSIRTFGLVQPLVADENNIVIAGAGLLQAAITVGYEHVPVVRVKHLNEASKKALRIALNKLAELSHWDDKLLAIEFNEAGVGAFCRGQLRYQYHRLHVS